MRLPAEPALPANPQDPRLTAAVKVLLRAICARVNALSDGRLSAIDATGTTAPTTGTWAQGDQIRNSNPTEMGTAGSKYVVLGWVAVSGGSPGTWKEMRVLTGG